MECVVRHSSIGFEDSKKNRTYSLVPVAEFIIKLPHELETECVTLTGNR